MADNPKSLASLADELEHGLTPAEMERVCRYVASKGWQGNLGFMRATLAAIEDAGFAVVPREAAAALRAPSKSLADDLEALAKRIQTGLPNAAADLCFRAAAALRAPTIAALEPMTDKPKAKRASAANEFHRRVFARWGSRCYFCDGPASDAMHLFSRAHLGPHRYACPEENGRPGCRSCHDMKGWLRVNFAMKDRRMAMTALNRVLTEKLKTP